MDKNNLIKMKKWETETEEKYHYYVHVVTDDEEATNTYFKDCHTHKLLKNYGHLDLQIIGVPNMSIDTAKKIIDSIVDDIKADAVYLDSEYAYGGNKYPGITKVVKEHDSDRMILRIIIPDPSGKYPWDDGCDPDYKKQFTEEDEKENKYLMSL